MTRLAVIALVLLALAALDTWARRRSLPALRASYLRGHRDGSHERLTGEERFDPAGHSLASRDRPRLPQRRVDGLPRPALARGPLWDAYLDGYNHGLEDAAPQPPT